MIAKELAKSHLSNSTEPSFEIHSVDCIGEIAHAPPGIPVSFLFVCTKGCG
jgi:hypothetical protein